MQGILPGILPSRAHSALCSGPQSCNRLQLGAGERSDSVRCLAVSPRPIWIIFSMISVSFPTPSIWFRPRGTRPAVKSKTKEPGSVPWDCCPHSPRSPDLCAGPLCAWPLGAWGKSAPPPSFLAHREREVLTKGFLRASVEVVCFGDTVRGSVRGLHQTNSHHVLASLSPWGLPRYHTRGFQQPSCAALSRVSSNKAANFGGGQGGALAEESKRWSPEPVRALCGSPA